MELRQSGARISPNTLFFKITVVNACAGLLRLLMVNFKHKKVGKMI